MRLGPNRICCLLEVRDFSEESSGCDDGEADAKTPHETANDSEDFVSE